MFSAEQIVAHLLGDYVLQSPWMATCKTSSSGDDPASEHEIFLDQVRAALTDLVPTTRRVDVAMRPE